MPKLLVSVFLVVLGGIALAAPDGTAVVEEGDLEIAIRVKGSIGPGRSAEMRLKPLAYRGRYEVVSATEPGSMVSEGEPVLRFDDKAIREALDKARFDLVVARRDMAALRERHSIAARASEIGVESKERDLHQAELSMERYHEHTLPQANRRAAHDEEGHERSVENAKEELAQLEKMYEEDELVDDTEEIVLRRARWDVTSRERRFGYWRFARALTLKYDNPTAQRNHRWSLMLKRIALDKARREAEMAEVARRTEMERAERAMDQRLRGMEELEADLAGMVVRAPRAGILLHGKAGSGLGRVYSPGDQINLQHVIVTVADPDDLRIHMKIGAGETLRLAVGQILNLKADAVGADGITAHVEHRDILPRDGAIKVRAKAEGELPAGLLGIAVSGRLIYEVIDGALLLPLAAVERDGDAARVYVAGKDGQKLVVDVEVGMDNGTQIVIVSGVKAGDIVFVPEAVK